MAGLFLLVIGLYLRYTAAVQDVNNQDFEKSVNLPPINVNKKFTLLDKSIPCGANVKAGVKISGDAKATANIAVGVAASGTIVPPKLDDFEITASE